MRQPDLVRESDPITIQNGKSFPWFLGAGPCGDVYLYEDRVMSHDAVWCGPVTLDVLLTVEARLEVF